MKIPLPKNKYIKKIEVGDSDIDIEFLPKKKIALLFISLNPNYWPYFQQVVEDCKQNFLPHHNVDYFVWSDMPEIKDPRITVIPTEPIEWPHPTLMRYHLFLNEEEKLKDYDYIFYLDADMRVVQKISDEVLGEDLTVALHPMYDLNPTFIPPYEPNKNSAAFIPRLGHIIDDAAWRKGEIKTGKPEEIRSWGGQPRFRPLYLAGGFQGGKADKFIEIMKLMKENIDKDFNKNYTAIWNDESHWNKAVFETRGPILGKEVIVLGPEYIYPDSLIAEYYEPRWGRKLVPKIITLTKPFSLSKEGGQQLNEVLGNKAFYCPTCNDLIQSPGFKVVKVVHCNGTGKPHQAEMIKA